ncbi:MAG TPA: hypothetical protein ENI66_00305 [Candidatus Yonathbacteria bacterium]|nr:hypothetical protein [Candidatus Yonathbacteria bacterium]
MATLLKKIRGKLIHFSKRLFEIVAYSIPISVGWVTNGLYGISYVVLAYALLLVLVYTLARRDKYATTMEPGEIKLIVAGDSLIRVLLNIDGRHYDDASHRIVTNEDWYKEYRPLITVFFGIYWVSIFHPIRGLFVYQFEWDNLVSKGHLDENEENGKHIVQLGASGDYFLKHRDEPVDSIYWRYTYPVFAEQVELKDNFKVDVLANITFEVFDPYFAVFIMRGKWLTQSTVASKGAIADFGRNLDINEFRSTKKHGDDSEFSKAIMHINGSTTGRATSSDVPQIGIIEAFGAGVYKVDYVKFDLSEGQEDAEKATKAVQIADLNARATIKTATGDAVAVRRVGKAEAKALTALMGDGSPARAAVLQEQVRTKGLVGFKGSVLSLGGGGTPILVDGTQKDKHDADAEKSS